LFTEHDYEKTLVSENGGKVSTEKLSPSDQPHISKLPTWGIILAGSIDTIIGFGFYKIHHYAKLYSK
jgi:hypothetical protein